MSVIFSCFGPVFLSRHSDEHIHNVINQHLPTFTDTKLNSRIKKPAPRIHFVLWMSVWKMSFRLSCVTSGDVVKQVVHCSVSRGSTTLLCSTDRSRTLHLRPPRLRTQPHRHRPEPGGVEEDRRDHEGEDEGVVITNVTVSHSDGFQAFSFRVAQLNTCQSALSDPNVTFCFGYSHFHLMFS